MDEPPVRHRQFTRGEVRRWQNASAEEGIRVGTLLIREALAFDPDNLRRAEEWKRRLARRS